MPISSSNQRIALVLRVLAVSLVFGCGKHIYTDDELKTQERFRSVEVGTSEQALVASLGAPLGVAARTASGELAFEFNEGGVAKRIALDANDRSQWPRDLQFLPDRPISAKVLVYTEGTVTAYYFIGPDGRIEDVNLFTS